MSPPHALALLLAAAPVAGWPIDPAPKCQADAGSITVCGQRIAPDRYRLPRNPAYELDHPVEHGWGALSRDMDDAGRLGMPGSNSAIGSGGQTGQRAAMVRDYARWRDGRK